MCLVVFLRHQLKLSEPFNQSACCFKGVAKIVVATLPYRCHGKLLVYTGCSLVRTALRPFVRHLTSKHCSVDSIVMEAKQANKETNRPKKTQTHGWVTYAFSMQVFFDFWLILTQRKFGDHAMVLFSRATGYVSGGNVSFDFFWRAFTFDGWWRNGSRDRFGCHWQLGRLALTTPLFCD